MSTKQTLKAKLMEANHASMTLANEYVTSNFKKRRLFTACVFPHDFKQAIAAIEKDHLVLDRLAEETLEVPLNIEFLKLTFKEFMSAIESHGHAVSDTASLFVKSTLMGLLNDRCFEKINTRQMTQPQTWIVDIVMEFAEKNINGEFYPIVRMVAYQRFEQGNYVLFSNEIMLTQACFHVKN